MAKQEGSIVKSNNQNSLQQVDWSKIPEPKDDGEAEHLTGMGWPDLSLPATSGELVNIAQLEGLTIVFAYPMTGRPDVPLPDNWDMTPGARGCTPQACSFRDAETELNNAGVSQIFGLSVQDTAYQQEARERLHLPYHLLSDADGGFQNALMPPMLKVAQMTLFRRISYAVRGGTIEKVWYPVFPPDRNVDDVLDWLKDRP